MKKVLIIHYFEAVKGKLGNEAKVAAQLSKRFSEKGFEVNELILEPIKKLGVRDQFKREKEIEFKKNPPALNEFDVVVIGTPIVNSFTSSPIVNAFIRSVKNDDNLLSNTKFVLYATGIIPGFAIKKMTSLLSMKGIKPIDFCIFTSIFDFDAKKINEIDAFFSKLIDKIEINTEVMINTNLK